MKIILILRKKNKTQIIARMLLKFLIGNIKKQRLINYNY